MQATASAINPAKKSFKPLYNYYLIYYKFNLRSLINLLTRYFKNCHI